jgi:manganese/zinc/iron transport system permease protein
MESAWFATAAFDLSAFGRALIYDAPHNTVVVLRGTMLLGLACGVVGVFLLLRKRSLVADALSHAALPGVCVGFMLAASMGVAGKSLFVLIPAAAVFGLLGVACIHLLTRVPRIKEDAAIGAVLSVFFALGMVLLSLIQRMPVSNKAGLNHFIFGQAATMSAADSNTIAVLAALVLLIAWLANKELKLLCFDAKFAQSLGWSTLVLDGVLLMMVTILTVIGLHAVGAILMVALLIIPAAAARFWTQRLMVMVALSAAFGAIACHAGVAVSAIAPHIPTGPAIVVACGSLFIVSLLIAPKRGLLANAVRRMSLGRSIARQHLLRAMYEQGEIAGQLHAPVMIADLMKRRAWSSHALHVLLRRAMRRGEVRPDGSGYVLSDTGREAAARIVRTHRLWEHFLTTQADIAPSHVDRAADDIEHVLSDELIRDLEQELRERGALPEGAFVPTSPHRLAAKEAAA